MKSTILILTGKWYAKNILFNIIISIDTYNQVTLTNQLRNSLSSTNCDQFNKKKFQRSTKFLFSIVTNRQECQPLSVIRLKNFSIYFRMSELPPTISNFDSYKYYQVINNQMHKGNSFFSVIPIQLSYCSNYHWQSQYPLIILQYVGH